MDECIKTLETSPLALPSDKQFCQHIQLQRSTDEYSRNLLASHFFRPRSVSRPDTVEILNKFKRQIDTVDDSISSDNSNGTFLPIACRHI